MYLDPSKRTLSEYRAPIVLIECARCPSRHAELKTAALRKRYGNPTMGELARLVAANAQTPCALATDAGRNLCSARAREPSVDTWGTLDNARIGKWRGTLYCQRNLAALKRATGCPEPFPLDVYSLIAALGHDFPLDRLRARAKCPACSSARVAIVWEVPEDQPDPGGQPQQQAAMLQLRPMGAAKGLRKFRAIDGGK